MLGNIIDGCTIRVVTQNKNLNIQYGSKHLIHADLLDKNDNPLSITFVYGQPDYAKREEVWFELKQLKTTAHPN